MEARYSLPGIFDDSPSLEDIFLAALHQRARLKQDTVTGGVAGFIGVMKRARAHRGTCRPSVRPGRWGGFPDEASNCPEAPRARIADPFGSR